MTCKDCKYCSCKYQGKSKERGVGICDKRYAQNGWVVDGKRGVYLSRKSCNLFERR